MKKFYLLAFLATFLSFDVYSQIGFVPSSTQACLPATINFTNTSSVGDIYQWNFGDGGTATSNGLGAGTSHVYTTPGQFYVNLDVFDSGTGYIGSISVMVTIEGLPLVPNFSDTTICPGDEVSVDIGNTSATSIDWDFDDLTVLTNTDYQGVRHIYNNVGTYTVNITVNFTNCGTQSTSIDIHVGNSYPIDANYPLEISTYQNPVCPGDLVEFEVPYLYSNYYINYGDGVSENATYFHSYISSGDYVVSVNLVNGCGNTLVLYDTVNVQNGLPVNVFNNTLVYDTVCINTNVDLNAPGSEYASYEWNFGNGNLSHSENAMIAFPSPGNYPISLTVTNGCGNSGIIYDTVNVATNLVVNNLVIDGVYSTNLCANDGFFMSAEVDGGWDQNSFVWNFGDGNTATSPNISHSYASIGTYIISLTATNYCGNSATISDTITVGSNVFPLASNYMVGVPDETIFCPGDSVVLIFGPGSVGSSVYWDFGDGDNGFSNDVLSVGGVTYNYIKHAYSTTGIFTPELTYTNSCGNSFSQQISITVANGVQPVAGYFEDELIYNCQGQPVTFLGMGGSTFIWNFGDGSGTLITNSPISPVEHIFEEAGSYNVTVEVINGCGLSDEHSNILVIPESKINITTNSIDATCNNSDGKAIAVVDGGIAPYEYQWSNGDMIFMADSIPAGIYLVNVEDRNGCKNFAIATVTDEEAATILTAAVVNPSCYGDNSGAIDISVIGNSAPYSFVWSNGSTNEDVNQLEAGPHEIIVTDANGCISSKSILVESPGEVIISTISENADCGIANGKAAAAVSGSTGPYNYLWSNGASGSLATGLGGGIYSLVVIDANGCIFEESIAVSEGDLNIVLDSITGTGCTGDLAGIYIRVLPNGNYDYSWSNSATSEDINNLSTGIYSVDVRDINSACEAFAQYSILDIPTNSNEICIVTVDSISNTNRVVWEKDLISNNISHYNIHKESSQSGVYYLIDQVDYDSLSNWTDPVSNPQVRAWRYKISVVDDCGNESVVSNEHKTIHLTVNEGINNTYNLIWDHYDGLTYSTYDIYRKTASGAWTLLTSIPSNLNSYTDATPPTDTEYYRVEALTLAGCDPTRAGVNTSRSNIRNTPSAVPFGESISESELDLIAVYPNPSNGIFTIDISVVGKMEICVYNSIGEQIIQKSLNSNTNLDLSRFSDGIYFLHLSNEKNTKTIKLIKQ